MKTNYQQVAAAAVSDEAATELGDWDVAKARGQIFVRVAPTGANLTEFHVDVRMPGESDWDTILSNTDFADASGAVLAVSATGPHEVADEAAAFAWIELPPCERVRFRAKASGAGTCKLTVAWAE